ncbi:MAG: hemerythrin domain-containing protein [Nannocystaceae bacterium]|nr:hemerythrin domain-containing protein [Nannocystaceae bacterium]
MTPPDSEFELPNEDLLLDLDRLHAIAMCPAKALPDARLRRLIEREVRQLHGVLQRHFEAEEEGRYMGAVLDRVPDLNDTVERLHAQHSEITTRLLSLASDCKTGALDELRDRAAALLDLIGEHERDEVKLVEKAR